MVSLFMLLYLNMTSWTHYMDLIIVLTRLGDGPWSVIKEINKQEYKFVYE